MSNEYMITVPPKLDDTVRMDFKIGIVKFFNHDKGYGFIQRIGESDLFFHAANYRDVVLNRAKFHLKLVSPEPEMALVPVKPKRRYSDDFETILDEIEADLDDGWTDPPIEDPPSQTITKPAPVMQERLIVKPKRSPKTGDIVSYHESKSSRSGKIEAQFWFYSNDYPLQAMRDELDRIYESYKSEVEAMPKYRVDRRELIYGPPKANNVKKCFESELIKDNTVVIFYGNNFPRMKEVIGYHVKYTGGPNVSFPCYVQLKDGSFVPCETPN